MQPLCDAYSDVLGPGGIAFSLVLLVIQYGRVRREDDNHCRGFQSDGRGELGGVKPTPEVGVSEIDTSILDLHSRRRIGKSPLTVEYASWLHTPRELHLRGFGCGTVDQPFP